MSETPFHEDTPTSTTLGLAVTQQVSKSRLSKPLVLMDILGQVALKKNADPSHQYNIK